MVMTETAAREIVMVWKDHYYPGRLKTNQVLIAEEFLKSIPAPDPASIDHLKLMVKHQTELIKAIEKDPRFNQSEKMYLLKLHKEIRSFYDRYYRREIKKK
jgi:hypothetical protein